MIRTLLIAVLIPFSVLSVWALGKVGYIGIWTSHMHPAGYQVITDLIIMAGFAMAWMIKDARETGRNPWPFIAITIPFGSFGPLLYWLLAPRGEGKAVRAMG